MQGCSGGFAMLHLGFAKQAGIKHPRDAPAVHLDADEQISELAFPS
jgi:hypothetical protein